jgi:hypothetical protein
MCIDLYTENVEKALSLIVEEIVEKLKTAELLNAETTDNPPPVGPEKK